MRQRCLQALIAVSAVLGTAVTRQANAQSIELLRFDHFTPHELRSATLRLTEPATIDISASGADNHFRNKTNSINIKNGNYTISMDEDAGWRGNAWILDAATREPVWELRTASTDRGSDGERTFHGTVRLKPGTYEVYYASYSAYRTITNMKDVCLDDTRKCQITNRRNEKGHTRYYDDGLSDDFQLVLRGNGRVEQGVTEPRPSGTSISLKHLGMDETARAGFALDKPTRVQIYAVGEVREDGEFDYGSIMNADTHEPVWMMDFNNTEDAGGARKNRVARETITLPAGRYVATYTMDDSHDPDDWNQSPPFDPQGWGMTVTPVDGSSIRMFDYTSTPPNAIVSINRVGNSETRSESFTLDRPMDVHIFALGEATSNDMSDYGWITDAQTHRRVWSMQYRDTEHAGGDNKNRMQNATIHLDAGSYIVNYRTDSSHAYDDWNSGPPLDGEMWGITVTAADPRDISAAKPYKAPPEAEPIAQIVRVGDNAKKSTRFSMNDDGDVRVYAIGEGTGGSMDDYGWIEDARGRVVWEMTYRMTEHAGGASKNRMYDDVVHLPAGQYVLHYESDGSHSYRDWNDDAPDDPSHWGITVYPVKRGR